MSQPFLQQQPPPVMVPVTQHPQASHGGWGNVGPVVGVLAVVMVLGVIAGFIGRLCAGRRVLGYGQYDVEGWMEDKCASCIDGRLDVPRPPPSGAGASRDSVPIVIPMSVLPEVKHQQQEGQQSAEEQQPPGNAAEP